MIQTLFGSLDEQQKPSFLERMKEAVTRTRESLSERIEEVVSFGKEIDRATLDDLEGILLSADLGTSTTQEILGKLREKADYKQIRNVAELKGLLQEGHTIELKYFRSPVSRRFAIIPVKRLQTPFRRRT